MQPLAPPGPYEVRLPAFEGPLDLLLQLVEREDLPISDVSLAQVTDAYLRRVRELAVPPEEISHFLVVASRLLLLKSRALLPRAPSDPPDPSGEDLAQQLREYRRFRAAAEGLRALEGRRSFPQLAPPPPPQAAGAVVSLPAGRLTRALDRTLRRLPRALPEGPPVPRPRLRLADVLARGEQLIRREGRATLDQLAGEDPGRGELIVAFLAALELVRRGKARVVQEGLYTPIVLHAVGEVH